MTGAEFFQSLEMCDGAVGLPAGKLLKSAHELAAKISLASRWGRPYVPAPISPACAGRKRVSAFARPAKAD